MRNPPFQPQSQRLILTIGVILTLGLVAGFFSRVWAPRSEPKKRVAAPVPTSGLERQHPLATWPWPQSRQQDLAPGVRHWHAASNWETLDLLEFDFPGHKQLRFEIFDADLDNAKPGQAPANRFAYWEQGPGVLGRRMNRSGDLLAAFNGSYWGLLNRRPRARDRSFHLSPVVHSGKVFYGGINRRWTWGAKVVNGRPQFVLMHQPTEGQLRQNFHFATGTLQALLKDGALLRLAPYPPRGQAPLPLGLPSTPQEAGAISVLDHMHTSRVGAGWTPSGRLFVLVVKEADGEVPSREAVLKRRLGEGGWTLLDHQSFWVALQKEFGVQNAVGLDGGDVAQAMWRQPDGNFQMLVPRISLPPEQKATQRLTSGPAFNAPRVKGLQGGALNYFVVRTTAP